MTGIVVVTLLVRALAEIGKIALDANQPNAGSAIMVIRAIYEAAMKADRGEITAAEADTEITKLISAIKANDATADKALDDKFDKG